MGNETMDEAFLPDEFLKAFVAAPPPPAPPADIPRLQATPEEIQTHACGTVHREALKAGTRYLTADALQFAALTDYLRFHTFRLPDPKEPNIVIMGTTIILSADGSVPEGDTPHAQTP